MIRRAHWWIAPLLVCLAFAAVADDRFEPPPRKLDSTHTKIEHKGLQEIPKVKPFELVRQKCSADTCGEYGVCVGGFCVPRCYDTDAKGKQIDTDWLYALKNQLPDLDPYAIIQSLDSTSYDVGTQIQLEDLFYQLIDQMKMPGRTYAYNLKDDGWKVSITTDFCKGPMLVEQACPALTETMLISGKTPTSQAWKCPKLPTLIDGAMQMVQTQCKHGMHPVTGLQAAYCSINDEFPVKEPPCDDVCPDDDGCQVSKEECSDPPCKDVCPEPGCQEFLWQCQDKDECPDVPGTQSAMDGYGTGGKPCNPVPDDTVCTEPDPGATFPNATVICVAGANAICESTHLDFCASKTEVLHVICDPEGKVTSDVTPCCDEAQDPTCKNKEYICLNGLCKEQFPPEPNCVDTDNGANDPTDRQMVHGKWLNGPFTKFDKCKDEDTVFEYSCNLAKADGFEEDDVDCAPGQFCDPLKGECGPAVTCTEDDDPANMQDIYAKETLTITEADGTTTDKPDYCADEQLVQYACTVATGPPPGFQKLGPNNCPVGEICDPAQAICVTGSAECILKLDDDPTDELTVFGTVKATKKVLGLPFPVEDSDTCASATSVKNVQFSATLPCVTFGPPKPCDGTDICENGVCIPKPKDKCIPADHDDDPTDDETLFGAVTLDDGSGHVDHCINDELQQVGCAADGTTWTVTKQTDCTAFYVGGTCDAGVCQEGPPPAAVTPEVCSDGAAPAWQAVGTDPSGKLKVVNSLVHFNGTFFAGTELSGVGLANPGDVQAFGVLRLNPGTGQWHPQTFGLPNYSATSGPAIRALYDLGSQLIAVVQTKGSSGGAVYGFHFKSAGIAAWGQLTPPPPTLLRSWTMHNGQLIAGTVSGFYAYNAAVKVWDLIGNPLNEHKRLYSHGGGLYVSHGPSNVLFNKVSVLDEAANDWTDISKGLPVKSVETLGSYKGHLYATTYTGSSTKLHRFDGIGPGWILVSESSEWIHDFLEKDDLFFTATSDGPQLSLNAGTTWQKIAEDFKPWSSNVIELMEHNNELYEGAYQGVFRYTCDPPLPPTEPDITVIESCEDGTKPDWLAVGVDPTGQLNASRTLVEHNGVLYAGTQAHGVQKFDAVSKTWSAVNGGLSGKYRVDQLYSHDSTLYAVIMGLAVSGAEGSPALYALKPDNTWEVTGAGQTRVVYGHKGVLYTGRNLGIYTLQSSAPWSWQYVATMGAVPTHNFHTDADGNLYVAHTASQFDNALRISRYDETSGTLIDMSKGLLFDGRAIAFGSHKGKLHLYATFTSSFGYYRYDNATDGWKKMTGTSEKYYDYLSAKNGLLSGMSTGTKQSIDDGNAWSTVGSDGEWHKDVQDILHKPDRLYAAGFNGVFKYSCDAPPPPVVDPCEGKDTNDFNACTVDACNADDGTVTHVFSTLLPGCAAPPTAFPQCEGSVGQGLVSLGSTVNLPDNAKALEEYSGNLYAGGTYGVFLYDAANDQWNEINDGLPSAAGIGPPLVYHIQALQAYDGKLYALSNDKAAGENSLYTWVAADAKWVLYQKIDIPTNAVYAFHLHNGAFWVGTPAGLFRHNASTGLWSNILPKDTRSLYTTADGLLVAGHVDGTVAWYNQGEVTWIDMIDGLPTDAASYATAFGTYQGQLYTWIAKAAAVGAKGGLYRYAGEGKQWEKVSDIQLGGAAGPVHNVRAMSSHKGLLFVATDVGTYLSINPDVGWLQLTDSGSNDTMIFDGEAHVCHEQGVSKYSCPVVTADLCDGKDTNDFNSCTVDVCTSADGEVTHTMDNALPGCTAPLDEEAYCGDGSEKAFTLVGGVPGLPHNPVAVEVFAGGLYAGGLYGVYLYDAANDTWTKHNEGLPQYGMIAGQPVRNIHALQTVGTKLYALSANLGTINMYSLYTWSVGSAKWKFDHTITTLPIFQNVMSFALHNGKFWIGTNQGVFWHVPGTTAWTKASTIKARTLYSTPDNVLVAGQIGGVVSWLNDDDGTWVDISAGLPNGTLNYATTFYTHLGQLFTWIFKDVDDDAPQGGLYRYEDPKKQWEKVADIDVGDADVQLVQSVRAVIIHDGTKIAATSQGLYTSYDSGNTWKKHTSSGGHDIVLYSGTPHVSHQQGVSDYDCMEPNEVAEAPVCEDDTEPTWYGLGPIGSGVKNQLLGSMAYYQKQLYAGGDEGVTRYNAITKQWEDVNDGLPVIGSFGTPRVMGLVAYETALYVLAVESIIEGVVSRKAYHLNPGATTWKKTSSISQITSLHAQKESFYFGTESGSVFRATGGPQGTLLTMDSPSMIDDVNDLHTSEDGFLYAALMGQTGWRVARYNGPANNWTNVSANLPEKPARQLGSHKGVLFVWMFKEGLYRYDNSALIWEQITMPVDYISDFISVGHYFFAATSDGVYMSLDGGLTWSPSGPHNDAGSVPVSALIYAYGELHGATDIGVYRYGCSPNGVELACDASQHDIVAIDAGMEHTCATVDTPDALGTVWCWGDSNYGQSGWGSFLSGGDYQDGNWYAAHKMPFIEKATAIATGHDHTCAALNYTGVKCWGKNFSDQLGTWDDDGLPVYTYDPPSKPWTDVSKLSAGDKHSCALSSEGTVWCWGSNWNDQLGISADSVGKSNPYPADEFGANLTESVKDITARGNYNCAVKGNGNVKCWGDAAWNIMLQAASNLTYSAVSAGTAHACALDPSSDLIKCSGSNNVGQLGIGSVGGGTTFTTKTTVGPSNGIEVGWEHTCAIDQNMQARCWGNNSSNQIPAVVLADSPQLTPTSPDESIGTVMYAAAGKYHTCLVLKDETVWCWGSDSDGQLGDGLPKYGYNVPENDEVAKFGAKVQFCPPKDVYDPLTDELPEPSPGGGSSDGDDTGPGGDYPAPGGSYPE